VGVALSPDQVHLLIEAASGWLAEFLAVEAGLGIRRGEALALRWSDIVGDEAYISRSLCQVGESLIFKGTKSGRDRRIAVPPTVTGALDRQRVAQGKERATFPDYRCDLDLVFCRYDGEPLGPDSVSAKVSLLCRRLKLPAGASLHALRHSHGSQLIADGESVANVSKRLGHANASTTLNIYTHAIPGDDRETYQRWEDIQGERPEKRQ
jgi:integrase